MASADGGRRSGPQSRAWRQLFRKQFHKTKMCRFYPSGECRYGTDCPYAHDESEITHAPDLTKTALCANFQAGCCKLNIEDCPFAHGPEDLRTTEAFSASPLCKRTTNGKDTSPTNTDADSSPSNSPQQQPRKKLQQQAPTEPKRQLQPQFQQGHPPSPKAFQAPSQKPRPQKTKQPQHSSLEEWGAARLQSPPRQKDPAPPPKRPDAAAKLSIVGGLSAEVHGAWAAGPPPLPMPAPGAMAPPFEELPSPGAMVARIGDMQMEHARSSMTAAMTAAPSDPMSAAPSGTDGEGERRMLFPRTPGVSDEFVDAFGNGTLPRGLPEGFTGALGAGGFPPPIQGLMGFAPLPPSMLPAPPVAAPLLSTSGRQGQQVGMMRPMTQAPSLGNVHGVEPRATPSLGNVHGGAEPQTPSLGNVHTLESPGRRKSRLSLVTDPSPGTTATPGSTKTNESPLEHRQSRTDSFADDAARWMADPAYLVPTEAGYRSMSPGGHSDGSGAGSPRRNPDDVSPVRCWPRTPSSCNSPVRAWALPPDGPDGTLGLSPGASPSPRRRARGGLTPAVLNNHLWNIFGTEAGPAEGPASRGRPPYNMSSVMEHSDKEFGGPGPVTSS